MARFKVFHFTIFLAIFSVFAQSQEITNSPDLQTKCGGCPCNNPCIPPPSPPPPALPPPSPPPPALPPPAPKKPPPSSNCPPPPSPPSGGGQYPPNAPYIFINGPPQDLYPVDANYNSGRILSTGLVQLLMICGALWLIACW